MPSDTAKTDGTSAPRTPNRPGRIHPGMSRRKGLPFPKGRHADPAAAEEIAALMGDAPPRRDLLIEHLHRIADSEGHLSARHLQALADWMRLPLAEVYEVASFYAHFDIVLDDEDAPPAVTVRVCDSLSCMLAGADDLMADLKERLGDDVRVVRAPCMGRCDCAPVAEAGHRHVDRATVDGIEAVVESGHLHPVVPDYVGLDAYRAEGGYRLLEACRAGDKTPEDIIQALKEAGLRGMGGAGFPSGTKWEIVRRQPKPRLFAINGDEGEPGTFKDRFYLERDPHRFLEGSLIAAWAAEAETTYIYLRDEYPAAREILVQEIAALEAAGLAAPGHLVLRRGAGAYICGEESAMIESIEGKRGLPRHKPPYPSEAGLFGLPTLTHNVETVYWVRDIVEKGPAWFADQGLNGAKGLRSFSVSGRVKEPGVKLAPAGITARQLIDDHCGGMADGHAFKAYLPGGASGGILPASMADLPLDFGQLEKHGCFVGSHAVVILSERDNMKDVALNLMRFFEDESCGQCTPCRNGTEKAVQLMDAESWDLDLLADLAKVMRDASICGLGQAAPNPLDSVIKFFPEDLA